MHRKLTTAALALGVVGALLLIGGLATFLGAMFSMANTSVGMMPGGSFGPMEPALPLGRLFFGMALFALGGVLLKLAWGAGLLGAAGHISESITGKKQ